MLEGLIARLGLDLLFRRIGKVIKAIPWQVWLAILAAILAAILLSAGYLMHRHAVHNAYRQAYAAGRADERKAWQANLAKAHSEAVGWKSKYDAASAALNSKIGENHALETRLIAARADDLLMHGPGQAAATCARPGDHPGPAGGAGGHDAAGGKPDDPLAPMPPDQPLAIVPWNDLTRFGRQADDNRNEALTWRTWYVKNAELLRKAKLELSPIDISKDAPVN